MPRVLVAGCGYVGEAAADLFFQAGWEVEGWTASASSAEKLAGKPYQIRAVDIALRDEVVEATASCFDGIIHCASSRGGDAEDYGRIYLEGARNLAAVFPRALLLFTSSTSVYVQRNGERVTELSPAEPDRETGRILRATEELILTQGGIVVRLAGIYGPSRSALLQTFLDGNAVIESRRQRFINQVHRDDIASALLLLLERHLGTRAAASSNSQIYNVADNHPILLGDCYEWLAAHLHRPVPPTGVTSPDRKRGNSNKRVSSEKLMALGWSPRYPTFQAGMAESVLPHAGL